MMERFESPPQSPCDTRDHPQHEHSGGSGENVAGGPEGEGVDPAQAHGPPTSSHEFATAGRNAMKLALSLTVTWTVAFFIRFPIPRMLGPERFGLLNFSENFAATYFAMVDLGVSTYIFREIPVRPSHASEFWGGLLAIRSLATVVLLAAMAATLAASRHSREVQLAVFVFGLAQFASIHASSVAALLHASNKVNRVAISNVASKLIWGVGLAAVLFFSRALPLLALPLLASELLRFFVLRPEARRTLDLKLRFDMRVTKAVLLASLPFFISGSAVNIGGRLNVAVLEFVIPDKREVGWFGASQNLASLTMILAPLFSWVLMPLLARARARSEQEVYEILRRTIEGLLVVIVPITLIVSLGADLWVRLAFRAAYDPAALSLRLLSLGFILIYLALLLSTLLIMTGHSWSVSMISLGAVPFRPILVAFLAVPCAHRFGLGGGAFGAALAEVVTSVGIVAAHFIPIGGRALDRRLLLSAGKSLAGAALVAVLDLTVLRRFGYPRLVIDAALYLAFAFATGAVKTEDVARVVRALVSRRKAQLATPGAAA
jgi:O-antigen/teichoic acid export membrane protein